MPSIEPIKGVEGGVVIKGACVEVVVVRVVILPAVVGELHRNVKIAGETASTGGCHPVNSATTFPGHCK